jgi:hypothetical protein
VFVVIVALFGLRFVFATCWTVIDASRLANDARSVRPLIDERRDRDPRQHL